jgi:hypothetical protein
MSPRPIRRGVAAICASLLLSLLVACHLSAQQVAQIDAFDGPACDALGGGISMLVAPLGGIVALVCKPIADEIAQAEETSPTPPADAGAPVKASASSSTTVTIAVSAPCKPTKIPGDPFGQVACPELHDKVLAAELRMFARRAAAKGSH